MLVPCWFFYIIHTPCYVSSDQNGIETVVGKTGQITWLCVSMRLPGTWKSIQYSHIWKTATSGNLLILKMADELTFTVIALQQLGVIQLQLTSCTHDSTSCKCKYTAFFYFILFNFYSFKLEITCYFHIIYSLCAISELNYRLIGLTYTRRGMVVLPSGMWSSVPVSLRNMLPPRSG
jgi:hypothetical protein